MGMKFNMKRQKFIFVTFQKEGIHCYPDAPKGVEFLKHPHRHMFHFRVDIEVFHDDRDIEFILFKRELEGLYAENILESCPPVRKTRRLNESIPFVSKIL